MFIIGERINPAGKPELSRAIRESNAAVIQREALAQERAGADALDINVFLPGIDRAQAMRITAQAVRRVSSLPLAIDDTDPDVIENGLAQVQGNGWINTPIDDAKDSEHLASIAKRYPSTIIFLPFSGAKIPEDSRAHVKAAQRIMKQLEMQGILKARAVVDAGLCALKKVRRETLQTLETLRRLKGELDIKTVIGLSNVSFGLKRREELNARFLKLAKPCGLDYVICDPLQKEVMETAKSETEAEGEADSNLFLEFAETCWK
jgi:5-methyltetrahydrofolate--homocysteine methyltransferase